MGVNTKDIDKIRELTLQNMKDKEEKQQVELDAESYYVSKGIKLPFLKVCLNDKGTYDILQDIITLLKDYKSTSSYTYYKGILYPLVVEELKQKGFNVLYTIGTEGLNMYYPITFVTWATDVPECMNDSMFRDYILL